MQKPQNANDDNGDLVMMSIKVIARKDEIDKVDTERMACLMQALVDRSTFLVSAAVISLIAEFKLTPEDLYEAFKLVQTSLDPDECEKVFDRRREERQK